MHCGRWAEAHPTLDADAVMQLAFILYKYFLSYCGLQVTQRLAHALGARWHSGYVGKESV